jgi:GMP synthase-like glutamine amidotransferase
MFSTDEQHYPWLRDGIKLIRSTVSSGRYFIGVCLGAQLLGQAFGGRISKNADMEFGWHAVQLSPQALSHPLMRGLPSEFVAFHWHHDVVSLPPDGTLLAVSAVCPNQAFAIGNRALGVQFHPEITERKARAFVDKAMPSSGGTYVQSPAEIFADASFFANQIAILDRILKNLLAPSMHCPNMESRWI